MVITELVCYLQQYLQVDKFQDYCPNGLQVAGREDLKLLVSAVTASQQAIELAIARRADALLVHHGYFWKGEAQPIIGIKKQRLQRLLEHKINLLAYHLPLDAHPEVGNNAQLARLLGCSIEGYFAEQNLACYGTLAQPCRLAYLCDHLEQTLARKPCCIGDAQRSVKKIAWCSGGAPHFFELAIAMGCDVYISGEASEPNYHAAIESGVAFIAAGHHATERYGVQALGEHLAQRFGVQHHYVELENPF